MDRKPQNKDKQTQKLLYGVMGGVILAGLAGSSFLGASADKEATTVSDLEPNDTSSQETKVESTTASKDASSMSQEKSTVESTSTPSTTTSSTSVVETITEVEQPSAPENTDIPVYESSNSESSSTNSYTNAYYDEPTSSSSNYSEPVYEEPASSTYTPSSPPAGEVTVGDIERTNKRIAEWNKANGFGGDNLDSGNGYLGW